MSGLAAALGGMQLSGCLGGDSQQAAAAPMETAQTQSGSTTPLSPASQPAPANQQPAPTAPANQPAPTATPQNSGPIWQPAPTIEFVEGVPATISVREFVRDPDSDPLVIALASGVLIPGLTWNPSTSTIAYDGRPLGAKEEAPVVVSGVVFTADDGKR
jgi:hypothetical protein